LDILTKPGMFYKQIKINNPDEGQRIEIIEKVLNFYNHNVGLNLKELSLLTAGYVAVDIISLFKEAAVRCVDRITAKK
jgi:SpoVK/Ycf46/Vps4 family AAA+-type ATPase